MGFASGFSAGSSAVMRGVQLGYDAEKYEREKEKHALDKEEQGLRIEGTRRQQQRDANLDEEVAGLRRYMSGEGEVVPMAGAHPTEPAQPDIKAAPKQGTPEYQAGLNQRLSGVAAMKGDFKAVQELQEKQVQLARQQALGTGIKQWYSMAPEQRSQVIAQGVNGSLSNPGMRYLTLETAPKPGPDGRAGYPAMVINPLTGQAQQQFLREDQAALVYGAMQLMETDPQGALQLIASVNKDIAAAVEAHNKEQLELYKAQGANSHYQSQDAVGMRNAGAHERQAAAAERQAGAAETNAKANVERASHEKQGAGAKMEDQVNALVKQYEQAYPGKKPEEYRQMALQAVTKDPDRKDPKQDDNLAGIGVTKINGRYFTMGKGGKPEPFVPPGESKLDKAIEARLAAGQQGKRPAPQAGITLPSMSQMTTSPGINPHRSYRDQITEAERKQNR
jgi:hypothetical protein